MSSGQWIRFCVAAILTMFAGSQAVHMYYQPLADLDELVERELKKRKDMIQPVESK